MPNELNQLRDIHLPNPIGMWPLAWGWWLVLVLVILAVTMALVWWRRHRYRFFANKCLRTYFNDCQQTKDSHAYSSKAAHLLREIAITRYGRSTVSNLHGNEWIIFLNAKVKAPIFDETTASYITQAPFCDGAYFNNHFHHADIHRLHQQLLHWVRAHQ